MTVADPGDGMVRAEDMSNLRRGVALTYLSLA